MSALAKAVMAFHEQQVVAQTGGAIWVPENVYEKWIELARRERPRPADKDALERERAMLGLAHELAVEKLRGGSR